VLVSDFDFPRSLPPESPYSSTAPLPSAYSYSSSSLASSVPGADGYLYELERLKIQYRASQESLRIERERAEAEKMLFERERVTREARHQLELESLRRELSSEDGTDKGKGKRGR